MWSVPIQMPRLPLTITCYSDAHISFAPYVSFDVVIEQLDDGSQIIINENEICLAENQKLSYNERTVYKSKPLLLKWLKSLDMEQPNFQ